MLPLARATIFVLLVLMVPSSCRKSASDSGIPVNLPGSWTQTNGPCSGLVETLLISGTTVFAGGQSLFSSQDIGRTWKATFSGSFPFKPVTALASKGDTILAAGQGLYRSIDYGTTWTEFGAGKVYCCLTSIAYQGSIIAMTSHMTGPVWLSVNDGETWKQTGSNLPDTTLSGILIHGQDLFVATSSLGIFRSADQGTTWEERNNGLGNLEVTAFISSGQQFIAATRDGLFYSDDDALTWHGIGAGSFKNKNIQCIAANGPNLLAGLSDGLLYSTDNGNTWSQAGEGLADPDVRSVAVSGSMFFAGGNNGLYFSENSGKNWRSVGLPITSVSRILAAQDDIYAAASNFKGGIYLSPDNGSEWKYLTNYLPERTFTDLAWTGSTLAAASNLGVFITADRGKSWGYFSSGLPQDSLASIASDGVNLYVGSKHQGVYVSHDAGVSWKKASIPLPADQYIMSFYINREGIYAGSFGGGVMFSADSGANWSVRSAGFAEGIKVSSFAEIGTCLFAGTLSGAYISTDKGFSWAPAGSYLEVIYSLAVKDNLLFASTGENGIQVTADAGKSWYPVNTGLPSKVRFFTLAVKGSWLLTGSEGRGVWRHPL